MKIAAIQNNRQFFQVFEQIVPLQQKVSQLRPAKNFCMARKIHKKIIKKVIKFE